MQISKSRGFVLTAILLHPVIFTAIVLFGDDCADSCLADCNCDVEGECVWDTHLHGILVALFVISLCSCLWGIYLTAFVVQRHTFERLAIDHPRHAGDTLQNGKGLGQKMNLWISYEFHFFHVVGIVLASFATHKVFESENACESSSKTLITLTLILLVLFLVVHLYDRSKATRF